MDKTLDLDELERVAREEWQALLEKDDRTSLAEYPEMCLITFDEVRDLIAAARPAVVSDEVETGWLIEGWDSKARALKAGWWTLEGENGGWTTDSTRALRFARKADAQAYIDDLGWTEAVPTEHQWGNPMRAALALLPGGVSDGYVLVPREPTEAMLEALADAIDPISAELWDRETASVAFNHANKMGRSRALVKADTGYRAMLSASPKEVSQ